MEIKFEKDVNYDIEMETRLAAGDQVSLKTANEMTYVVNLLLRKVKDLEQENTIFRKRLQHLEVDRKRRNGKEGPRGRDRSVSRPESKGKRNSDKGKGGKRSKSNNSSKSVRFGDSSKNSKNGDNKSLVSKSEKSKDSNKGKSKKETSTKIRVWKLLPEARKKKLRLEENVAFKKVPNEQWLAMTPLQRTIESKARKLRIQQFQEGVTAIALKMAQERAAEKLAREGEKALLKEENKMKDESGKGTPTSPNKNPSGKPPASGGKQGGGGGAKPQQSSTQPNMFLGGSYTYPAGTGK